MRVVASSFANTSLLVALFPLAGLAFAAACSSSSGTTPPASADAGTDAGSIDTSADAGDASEDVAPQPPQTFLRIANASPDSPPFDVCVAPHGTTAFQGPLLGQLAATLGLAAPASGDAGGEDAGAVALAFAQVSAYVPLSPGQYDALLVPAGAASCGSVTTNARPFDDDASTDAAAALDGSSPSEDAGTADASTADASPDAAQDGGSGVVDASSSDASSSQAGVTTLPVLANNAHATLLVAGDAFPAGADAPLALTVLPDDAVLAGGAVSLRAINAVPSARSLDFDLAADAGQVTLLSAVPFASAAGQVSQGTGVLDANDYLSLAPVLDEAIVARSPSPDAGSISAVGDDVEIDLGSIATVIAVGGKTGDASHPPALLLCIDNQPSGGLLSACNVVPR